MASGASQSKYRHAIQKQMQTQMSYHHLIIHKQSKRERYNLPPSIKFGIMELMRFIHRLLDLLQKRC